MSLKKSISKLLAAVFAVVILAVPSLVLAEEASQGQDDITFTYKHTSARYGYSIFCPVQPRVVPASLYNENDKGEVLIFAGNYSNIKKGWVVCINGYDSKVIPDNLGTLKESEGKEFLKEFAATYGMQYAQIVEVADSDDDGNLTGTFRYGICGPTATAVEVDSDGDGVVDSYAVAETQMMKIFLPGQYGGHFMLGLLEEGTLNQHDVEEFMNAAIYTLQQWPTSAYDNAKVEAEKDGKKKK